MRISERRIKLVRRRILDKLKDPVLIAFARGQRPKEIVLALFGVQIAKLRASGRPQEAEKFFLAKVRWVERRIMGAL